MPYPEPGPLDYLKIMWVLFRCRFWQPKSEKVRRHEDQKNDTKDDTTSTQPAATSTQAETRWSPVCPNAWLHASGDPREGGIMYVYIHSESDGKGNHLYTVGFYDPIGNWIPESDHALKGSAAQRVSYLNGGNLDGSVDVRGEISVWNNKT